MIEKQLIFIDDSGDPGFKNSPSEHFIMAAALFLRPEVATAVSEEMTKFRQELGWKSESEFKFRKTNKAIIKQLLKKIRKFDFEIYAVYINKREISKIISIVDQGKLYNWTIAELIKMMPVKNAKIEIDGRAPKKYARKITAYLRQFSRNKRKFLTIQFEDSEKSNLIQLADIVAGAIHRSLKADKTDSQEYLNLLKTKIVAVKRLDLRG